MVENISDTFLPHSGTLIWLEKFCYNKYLFVIGKKDKKRTNGLEIGDLTGCKIMIHHKHLSWISIIPVFMMGNAHGQTIEARILIQNTSYNLLLNLSDEGQSHVIMLRLVARTYFVQAASLLPPARCWRFASEIGQNYIHIQINLLRTGCKIMILYKHLSWIRIIPVRMMGNAQGQTIEAQIII